MPAPILFLGLAVAGGLALLSRTGSSSSSAASTQTTDQALIDPSEKTHPNAMLAQRAIIVAMHLNSLSNYAATATAIEQQLKMPKTAANVRTWAEMAKSGGLTVAGEDDEIGADDEVGARRRVVRRLYAKHKARPKPKPKRRAAPPPRRLSAPSSSSSSDSAEWEPEADEEPQTFEAADDEGDDDEVGAGARRGGSQRLPDWLRFSATQSMLAGDPKLIRATAQVMARMGHARHAQIYLKTALR